MLEFASASSTAPSTAKAAREACAEALSRLGGARCRLVAFHATMGHDVGAALAAIRELVPGARVVGCSCAGVIGRHGADESMRALALMAVGGEEGEVQVAHRDGVTGANSAEIGEALARDAQARSGGGAPAMAMLIGPGIDVSMDEMIRGVETVFGPELPIFGGTASDNMKGIATYQGVDREVFQHGAFLVTFHDPSLEVAMRATHGFVAAGVGFEVTRATDNRVYELDGEPAWRVYTRALGLPENATPGDAIPPGALGVELPAALAEEYGDTHLLRVVTHRLEDGSFLMPVTCPTGTRLSLVRRDEERIFANLAVVMNELLEGLGGRPPVAVFHTDCGARGRLLLDRVSKKEIVEAMQRPLFGETCGPWLGMYGFGEITTLGGRNVFHNYTTSLYVLSRRSS